MNFLKIQNFCKTGSGGTPSRSRKSEYYDGGEIPWIKSGELNRSIVDSAEEFITEKAVENSSAKILEPGAVLVAMYGATVGQVSRLNITATTNQAICHIYPDLKVCEPNYLYRVIQARKKDLIGKSVGGAQPNISQKIIRELQIPLPPLDEQKRIAGILDAADALRGKRRESLAKLDDLLQSTFLDMFGDPVTNPKGWEVSLLSDFCKTGSGGTPSRKKMKSYYEGGTIPWVKSGELRENVIIETGEHITEEALKESNVKLVPKGALLLALYGATVGRLGILGITATTNQAVCHIIPDPVKSDMIYMFHALSNQVPYLIGRGVGGAQPNISQGIVKSLKLPIPPLDLQQRFAEIVSSVEEQKAKMRKHLEQLDDLFGSLQQRAFRGDL